MKKIILLICALIPFVLNAQITNFSSATGTPQIFISTNLLGEGINAFNVLYNGTTSFNSTNQVGTFINTNTTGNLPKIGKGIVLSTGAFNSSVKANQNYQTSPYLRSLLNSLGQTSSINNVASFTFDFQSSLPQTSISSFDYFFATGEYPSYCSYADAFGFFIDGPYETDGTTRYIGNGMDYFESYYGKDIAVIPNSNATPVTVPALCSRVGTIFNGNSFTAGSTFGGYTIDLNTLSIVLLPGKIYKITIAICNYSDQAVSSSVFLSGGSFKAVPIITLEPSVITNNSASLDAIVLPSLGYTINGQGFQWRKKTVDNSESWIDVPIIGVQIVYNLEGLIPNTIYEYRGYVSAEDGQTFGDTKIFTTLSNPPASTPALSYTENTTNITTNSVTFNGGYITGTGTGTTISEKGFEYKTNLIQNWTVVSDPTTTSTSDGATTTKIITGLNPGTYYTVRAYVVSMGGTKHYGSIIPFTTLAAFGAPTLVYNNITTNTATVIWNTIDGAESYTLQYKEQGTSTWSSEILATANNRNIVLDSLSGNKTYDVRIRSNTSSPNDPSSWNMSSFTTLLPAPINLTTSNKTQSSVVINWDSIVGANNYTIQYKLKSASSWITYPTNPTTNQVQLTGLSLSEYQVKVKANKTSPSSSSDWSSILEFSISNSIATPSGTASNISASSATISWNAITDAVSYVFQYKLASASSWSSEQIVNADNRLINLTSLDTNALYYYRIKSIASDSSLNSGWGSSQFKTLLGTPIGSASSITASSATISWNAITDAVSYVFQYKLASSASSWSSEQIVNADNRLINLTSLDTNALYDYRIKSIALDSSLNSGWGSSQFKTLLG
ncbi:MAG: choice-of-anchor L domain-containing protein, partial [Bacteroidales bacterium]